MRTVRLSDEDDTYWTRQARDGRWLWYLALAAVDELCASRSRRSHAANKRLFAVLGPGRFSFQVGPVQTEPDDLIFYIDLEATPEAQRERTVAAMDAWAGGTYGSPDLLLERLRSHYWAPGFIHGFFETEVAAYPHFTSPLRPLAG
jgi:hypothetical protein